MIPSIAAGIYYLKLETKSGVISKKIIIK